MGCAFSALTSGWVIVPSAFCAELVPHVARRVGAVYVKPEAELNLTVRDVQRVRSCVPTRAGGERHRGASHRHEGECPRTLRGSERLAERQDESSVSNCGFEVEPKALAHLAQLRMESHL
jgi:hypothetical protein